MSKASDAAQRAATAATATLKRKEEHEDRVLDWTRLDSKLKPGTTGPEQIPPPRAETEQHWENIWVEEASHNTKRLMEVSTDHKNPSSLQSLKHANLILGSGDSEVCFVIICDLVGSCPLVIV